MAQNDKNSWQHGKADPYGYHKPFSSADVASTYQRNKDTAPYRPPYQKLMDVQNKPPRYPTADPQPREGQSAWVPPKRRTGHYVVGAIVVFGLLWVLFKIGAEPADSARVQSQVTTAALITPVKPTAYVLPFSSADIPQPCRSNFGSRECAAVTDEFQSGKYNVLTCEYATDAGSQSKAFSFWFKDVPPKMVIMAKADASAHIRNLGNTAVGACPATLAEATALHATNKRAGGL